MHYRAALPDKIKAQLRALPLPLRQEIGHKLFPMQEDLFGDVKKLAGPGNHYRLPVGSYRVFFEPENETVTVYDIGHSKDIYR